MKDIAICTVVSLNYFAQAKSLWESLKKLNEDIDFYVLIVDRIQDKNVLDIKKESDSMNLFFVSDLNVDHWEEMAFKYDIVEFNTALKPYLLDMLFSNYNYDKVIYLDPDILVFHKMDELYHILDEYSIVLTPHILEDIDGGFSHTYDFLKFGIYNLGFLGLKNDSDSKKFLNWWKIKLKDQCFYDPDKGLAWDQKWIDLVPALFDNVYILKDPGYNVAFWNMIGRHISVIDNEFYVNSKYKLVFFHFSHYHPEDKEFIINYGKGGQVSFTDRPDLKPIFSIYYNYIVELGYHNYSKLRYGFDYFNNGEKIEERYRKIYQSQIGNKKFYKDPFDTKNSNSFYHYLNQEKKRSQTPQYISV